MSHEFDRETEWRTADGRHIMIKDMDLGHLVNVINWIDDNKESYRDRTLDIMINEAKYRQTELFAKCEPYPQFVNRRWRIVDPKTGEGKIIPPPEEYVQAASENQAYQKMAKKTQAKRRKEGLI